MLEVFVNFICAFLLAITGFYIIKKISKTDKKMNIKDLAILVINGIMVTIIHNANNSSFSTLFMFILNTITYKEIFKISIEEAFIETGLLSGYIMIIDVIVVLIETLFIKSSSIVQNNIYVYLISNIIVVLLAALIIRIKILINKLQKLLKILLKKDLRLNTIFILLIMIAASGAFYSIVVNYNLNMNLLSNILIIVGLVTIGLIFIKNKDNYYKLSDEYNTLLLNVQYFEEWIEKEQFTRHEYKNQLAVLFAISKEKKVKNKIEEIINENLNIEGKIINSIRLLPKGGLKGILYYKTIVAQNKGINVTVDVSIKEKGLLSKMPNRQLDIITKLIGIYYDNAIEAAQESKKKNILVEIYEIKNTVTIVISNTFNKNTIIEGNNKKGISSKGAGRGNGLYFASKILNKNKYIKEKHEIIDKYYIETLIIQENTSKK